MANLSDCKQVRVVRVEGVRMLVVQDEAAEVSRN